MEEFSKNFKRIRMEIGIPKLKLANELNVAISTVDNWEKGKRLPNILNLFKLCEILRCSSDEILGVKIIDK